MGDPNLRGGETRRKKVFDLGSKNCHICYVCMWARILPDQKSCMGSCVSVWPVEKVLIINCHSVFTTLRGGHVFLRGGFPPLWSPESTSNLAPRTWAVITPSEKELLQTFHLQVILRMPLDHEGPFFFLRRKSSSTSWVFRRWLYVNFTNLSGFLVRSSNIDFCLRRKTAHLPDNDFPLQVFCD